MKATLYIKVLLVLPLLLFVDYLLMALIGCTSCLFGPGDGFYCGSFCLAGKIILALSALFFGYLIYPDIMSVFKAAGNGSSAKSKKDQ